MILEIGQIRAVCSKLEHLGVKRLAVYGLGTDGERIVKEVLSASLIDIVFIVDKRLELHGGRYHSIPVISKNFIHRYSDIDLFLVTALRASSEIKNELKQLFPALKVISTDELLD